MNTIEYKTNTESRFNISTAWVPYEWEYTLIKNVYKHTGYVRRYELRVF